MTQTKEILLSVSILIVTVTKRVFNVIDVKSIVKNLT